MYWFPSEILDPSLPQDDALRLLSCHLSIHARHVMAPLFLAENLCQFAACHFRLFPAREIFHRHHA